MKKLFLIFMLAVLVGLLPVYAETAEVSAGAPLITAMDVEGESNIQEKTIIDAIFTRVGDAYSEEKVKNDLKAIYALGYFSNVTTTLEARPGGVELVFKVTENPKVAQISIEGNSVYSTAEVLAMISTKVGNTLNYKKLQDDIGKITARYKKDGYMLARVVNVEMQKKTNILAIQIIEGRVESIVLHGNDATKDYVILREMKTKPGSVLNEEVLKKDLRRVFNLGFFSEVNPTFQAGSTKDKVILELDIKETRTSTVNFGGGYGEREGWFGFLDLSINNLMGTAQGLLIRGQAGQQMSTYQFKYNNPWFLPDQLGDHTALTLRKWYTTGRDVVITTQDGVYNGFDISLGKPFRDVFNATVTLGSENVTPYGTSTFEAYRSDTLALNLAYDTRDFWLNPHEGKYYTIDLKRGFTIMNSGDSNFFKTGVDLNTFFPTFATQTIATHLGGGLGTGNVPFGELYWAGGANTIRGYYPSEARTGVRKIIANVEYRMNFSDMFQGVFFFDWGNAWSGGPPIFTNFIYGWGPGVRVNTPMGPIRLDWGVPKGAAFGGGIMHFSIGQAF